LKGLNMRNKLISLMALCGAVGIYAAQDVAITIREVRDPVQLRAKLNANATDTESRLLQVESLGITNTTAAVTVGSLTTTGTVTIAEGALTASTVTSTTIKDATIVNADIATTAAIAQSKIATNNAGAMTFTIVATGTNFTFAINAQGIITGVTQATP
jgi:hypothetical protein